MAILLHAFRSCFAGHFSWAKDIAAEAEPGDLIEIDRGTYSHYVLSVGNGRVINIHTESLTDSTALIKEVELMELASDYDGCRIRNDHDQVALQSFNKRAKRREGAVREARKFLGKTVPYELLLRNCEYYCTLWKYGKGFSTQVINMKPLNGLSRYEELAEHCESCRCPHNFNKACHCGIDSLTTFLFLDGLEL